MIISTPQAHHSLPCRSLPSPTLSPNFTVFFFRPARFVIIGRRDSYNFKIGSSMGDPSETQAITATRRGPRNSYAKISLKAKLILFQRVLREEASTREVSIVLTIPPELSASSTLLPRHSSATTAIHSTTRIQNWSGWPVRSSSVRARPPNAADTPSSQGRWACEREWEG